MLGTQFNRTLNNHYPYWWLPIVFMAILTPFSAGLDLTLSRYFYEGHFHSNAWLDFIYQYAILPAWLISVGSLAVLINGFWWNRLKRYRRPAAVLALTLAIGSGLIIHGILKDHWGRPRPKQVVEFGGHQNFRPFYKSNIIHQPEPSKSFACGHCTMGFYFFALAFVGQHERSKKIYYGGMTLAWGLGLLLGITRIAQGGHFFSDVVVSGLIMWYTALVLTTYFYLPERPQCKD